MLAEDLLRNPAATILRYTFSSSASTRAASLVVPVSGTLSKLSQQIPRSALVTGSTGSTGSTSMGVLSLRQAPTGPNANAIDGAGDQTNTSQMERRDMTWRKIENKKDKAISSRGCSMKRFADKQEDYVHLVSLGQVARELKLRTG